VAGVVLKGDALQREFRWGTLTAVFAALAVFWIAIWVLDFTYYNRLLTGAVKALIAIERESAKANRLSAISLSIEIEDAVKEGTTEPASVGRWVFYTLVFGVLISGAVVSLWQYNNTPSVPVAATQPPPPPPTVR
jgi:hypothetical protein